MANAGHSRRPEPPALAQGRAQGFVADAKAGPLQRQQLGIADSRAQHRAVVIRHMPKQHRLAALLEEPRRMPRPGVQRQPRCQSSHQQAAASGALPQRFEFGRRRKGCAQTHLECDGCDFAHSQVSDCLLHTLNTALEPIQRRVHGLHHRGRQSHVRLDQAGHGRQVDIRLRQQQRELDQRLRLSRDVDVQRSQFGRDGHGSGGESVPAY